LGTEEEGQQQEGCQKGLVLHCFPYFMGQK
jgi:hypothetical protein